MRTLGFRTHVLFALAAAGGLVATLSRPWYAAAPRLDVNAVKDIGDVNGPLDGFFQGLERWVTETTGTIGWQALDQWALAMTAMAALAAVGALLCLLPPVQGVAREALRYGALAAFALATWKLLDPPGANGASELRYGAFAAFACAAVLLTSAMSVAGAPLRYRRHRAVSAAYAPPPPPAYSTTSSTAPPGQ